MRLYHHPMSSNARRCVMTAIHLGTKIELVVVDLAKGEQRKPDFQRMNPNGKVPVLEHDGFFLWESHAIQQYLAEGTPGQTLYPSEPRARADVNRWLFWDAHHFAPAVGILMWENVIKGFLHVGPPDPVEIARGENAIKVTAQVLDRHLEGKEWIAQGRLTLADLAIAAPLMATTPGKLPVNDFVHLQKWFARVQELDAWKKTNP